MSDSSGTQPEHHQQHEKAAQHEEAGAGGAAANDEYGTLIEFIRAQKRSTGDDEENDGSKIVKKRSMLTPWKVREVRVNKEGEEETVVAKVPASW